MCERISDNLLFERATGLNIYIKEPQQQAQACVIWMHGLGADAKDMMGVADQMPLTVPVRHVFIDAPIRPVTLNNNMSMRAWYDIVGMKLTDREDRDGLLRSEGMIRQIIENQMTDGFKSSQIFLAGFSQGSAMALFTGLRATIPLAGIIALSGYLPLSSECDSGLANSGTPIFIASGTFDPIVLPAWTKQSFAWLQSHGFQHVTKHEYPMEHSICAEEIHDMTSWLTSHILSIAQCNGVTQ